MGGAKVRRAVKREGEESWGGPAPSGQDFLSHSLHRPLGQGGVALGA